MTFKKSNRFYSDNKTDINEICLQCGYIYGRHYYNEKTDKIDCPTHCLIELERF